ncbi:hypothetical protein [Sodalis sp. dw_96]|uniref:hypothetical protein n=1 Tax=Sodalis sp. dw_96 TaxID=2719794 RepID=UPI001BD3C297|nr:hypothetical protein [Sodalis sp. dw_96]
MPRWANEAYPGIGHICHPGQIKPIPESSLCAFAAFHMDGHWDADGTQMATAISKVVARHGSQPTLGTFPWWLVPLLFPILPTMGELWEMRYLWRRPVRLDNTRLTAMLGSEPHTPLERALEETLAGLGCLPTG